MMRLAKSAVRVCIAAVLLWAAVTKLAGGAAVGVHTTIFFEWMRTPLERALFCAAEIALAILFLAQLWPRIIALWLIFVLSLFIGVLFLDLLRERPKPCGCMGNSGQTQTTSEIRKSLIFEVCRNGLLMAGTAWIFLAAPAGYSPGPISSRPRRWYMQTDQI
jgi:hypothetical protein